MTSKQKIKKLVSAPFSSKRNITSEFINIYRGAQMLPYYFDGNACDKIGFLSLIRNKNQKLELHFLLNVEEKPLWKCTLDQFDQLKRPCPNLICIELYGITTLFKFSDAQEARALYNAVEMLQCHVKIIHKSDIGLPTNFHELDMNTWNQERALMEKRPEPKNMASNNEEDKENLKPKLTKQKSIKNSFKTIINAAKRVKDTNLMEKAKFDKKPSIKDDDTSPLLF